MKKSVRDVTIISLDLIIISKSHLLWSSKSWLSISISDSPSKIWLQIFLNSIRMLRLYSNIHLFILLLKLFGNPFINFLKLSRINVLPFSVKMERKPLMSHAWKEIKKSYLFHWINSLMLAFSFYGSLSWKKLIRMFQCQKKKNRLWDFLLFICKNEI